MPGDLKRIPAVFYRSSAKNEPVRDWLKRLSKADRRIIGGDLKDVEFGWPVGMPLCRSLGDGLWEIRSTISNGRISRVIFCIWQYHIVLLHGFIKKTQKTPVSERKLALKRKREIEKDG
tara:strand:+ start:7120 stop:7476 length:357 start_codon:yes stop_codon:yes gene_type:complete